MQVVLRLESHEWDLMAEGARDKTARFASSDAWDMWAVKPCFAAILQFVDLSQLLYVLFRSL